jgi:hypothetical protein
LLNKLEELIECTLAGYDGSKPHIGWWRSRRRPTKTVDMKATNIYELRSAHIMLAWCSQTKHYNRN